MLSFNTVLTESLQAQPDLFNAKVRSLAFDRPKEEPSEEAQSHWLTRLLLKAGGYYSKESMLLRGAKALYEGICEQSLDPRLLKGSSCTCCTRLESTARQQLIRLGLQPSACSRPLHRSTCCCRSMCGCCSCGYEQRDQTAKALPS